MTMIPWKFRDNVPSLKSSDPFYGMTKMMDDYFGNFFNAKAWPTGTALEEWGAKEGQFVPKINLREGDNEIALTAELPGLNTKDLDITLEDNRITIKGERKYEREGGDKDRHYVESSYGAFQRTMALPYEVDKEKVKAQYKDGILKVNLYKSDKAKVTSRKISID